MRLTHEELAQKLRDNPDLSVGKGNFIAPFGKVPDGSTKYHSQRTGHYASKKEAQYAVELELRKKAGEVAFWLEQVPFPLPGIHTDKRGRQKRIVYRLDFLVFLRVDSNCGKILVPHFVEVKGRDLALGKLKRMQVSELYGIRITVV